jgi:hypothetical protein
MKKTKEIIPVEKRICPDCGAVISVKNYEKGYRKCAFCYSMYNIGRYGYTAYTDNSQGLNNKRVRI